MYNIEMKVWRGHISDKSTTDLVHGIKGR